MTSAVYERYLRAVTKNFKRPVGVGHHTTLSVNIILKHQFFKYKVRKIINYRSPMQTERSQPSDNIGNSVNLVSGIIRLPSGWDFSGGIGDR